MSPHSPAAEATTTGSAGRPLASARTTERQACPDSRCGGQSVRRAWIFQLDRRGDRPRRRRGRRHHLPVLQEQGRSALRAVRREDDAAHRRRESGARPGTGRALAAQAFHPPALLAGGEESRSRVGAGGGAAPERATSQVRGSAEARGRVSGADRAGRPRRAGARRAGRGRLTGHRQTSHLRRAGRAGTRVASVGPPRVAEKDRAGGRGVARPRSLAAAGRRKTVKLLVTIKRVEDYESKIKVKPDNSWIVTDGVNYRANPFDEIAVEEALRLRDANMPSEVVVVSIGPAAAAAEIRSGLAMGADRGILVKHDAFVDSDGVARLLKAVVDQEKPDLVLMGKQAVDVDDNVAGQLLAEYLGWGQATFASKKESLESPEEKAKKPGIHLGAGNGGAGSAGDGRSPKGAAPVTAQVAREVDGGLEVLEVQLPAIVTVDLRLNVPRYASLPNIMKAKKKPIEETAPGALEVDVAAKVKVVRVEAPPARAAGMKVPDVATLVKKLHEDAKVI